MKYIVCKKLSYAEYPHRYKGFMALTSILIISAVTLAIAMSVTLMSISSVNSSLGYEKGQETVKIGESCLEETLLRLRNDGNFSNVTVSVGSGVCNAAVYANGNIRDIWVTGTITGPPLYVKILHGVATRSGKSITLNSWTEAASTTPAPTPTYTPTPSPTPTNTPTPTPANCNAHCQQKYTLSGSCKKSNQCGGYDEGKIYECSSPNICCCE